MSALKLKHNYIAELVNSKKEINKIDNEMLKYMELLHKDYGYISLFKKINEKQGNRWSIANGNRELLLKCLEEENLYCSVNDFYVQGRHTGKYLTSLNALIIDLDYYNIPYLAGLTAEQVIGLLEMDLDFPQPTNYIDSGRGLYIIWMLEPTVASRKAKRYWRKIEQSLIDLFLEFGADKRVKDTARVLRLIGTINSKTGKKVRLIFPNNIDEEAFWNNPKRYELKEIAQYLWGYEEEKEDKPKREKNKNHTTNITTLRTAKNLHYTRARDLEKIVKLRKDRPLEGIREHLLFLYRLQLLMANEEQEVALKMVLDLNNKLYDPLNESEVISATESAVTNSNLYFELKEKYREEKEKLKLKNLKMKKTLNEFLVDNGVYLYRNSTIIKDLNITEDEMEHLETLINKGVKKCRKDIANKEYYIENKKDISDYRKQKYQEKIKKQGKKTKKEELKEIREKIKSLKTKGLKNKYIAQELDLPIKTLERHITYIKKNGLL